MTDRINGLPDTILLAIVKQIQNNVIPLNGDGACFIALDPEKNPGATAGDYFAIVSPEAGNFAAGNLDGGGQFVCTVESGFSVRIYSTAQIDPAKRDALFLTDESRGIFLLATQVLKALTCFDPEINGQFVVRDQILPKSFDVGRPDRGLGWLELRFQLNFDWDLS